VEVKPRKWQQSGEERKLQNTWRPELVTHSRQCSQVEVEEKQQMKRIAGEEGRNRCFQDVKLAIQPGYG